RSAACSRARSFHGLWTGATRSLCGHSCSRASMRAWKKRVTRDARAQTSVHLHVLRVRHGSRAADLDQLRRVGEPTRRNRAQKALSAEQGAVTREGHPARLTARRILYVSAKTCALRGWSKARWLEVTYIIAETLIASLAPGDVEHIAESVTW